jgi:hypothetical protein
MHNRIATLTLNCAELPNAPPDVHHVRSAFPRCLTCRRLDHCTGRAFPVGGHPVDFHQALRSERARLLDLRFNQRLLKHIEVLRVPVIGVANGLAIVVLRIATSDRSNPSDEPCLFGVVACFARVMRP